jgi:hypothetical protein
VSFLLSRLVAALTAYPKCCSRVAIRPSRHTRHRRRHPIVIPCRRPLVAPLLLLFRPRAPSCGMVKR